MPSWTMPAGNALTDRPRTEIGSVIVFRELEAIEPVDLLAMAVVVPFR